MRRNGGYRSILILGCSLAPLAFTSCVPEPEVTPTPPTAAQAEPTSPPGVPLVEVKIVGQGPDLPGLHPSDPLVLSFSVPISPPGDGAAVALFPSVDGSQAWNAGGDTLTFKPQEGFASGQAYSAYLHPGLRGPQGEHVASARLDFSVLAAPKVLWHSPGISQLTDRLPTVAVFFDRPMRADSVAQALQVAPAIELDLTWDGTGRMLTIIPRSPLPVGERYRFTIGPSAVDAQEIALGDDYHWAYWLADLELKLTPPQIGDLDGPILLEFNYPVQLDSLRQALVLRPAVPFELSMPTSTQARLTPQRPLSPSTEYEIRFTVPLQDPEGNDYPEVGSREFVSPPPILTYLPDPIEVPVDIRTIEVTFDRPMDQDRVEAAFSLSPAVPGHFSWQANTMTYHLEELLDYNADYTATIGQEAQDAEGTPVFQVPFSWSFSLSYFDYYGTFGNWGAKIQVVDAEGSRSLEFGLPNRGPTLVTFELHKLSSQQFTALARLNTSFSDPRLADVPGEPELTYSWEVTAGVRTSESGMEQLIIPEEVPPGLYLLRLRSDGRVEDEMAIVLSRYTLAVKRAGRQLLVWASEINGEIVPDMEIRVFATDGRLVREGLTDENGLFETTLAPGEVPLIIHGRTPEGGSTVAGVDNAWRVYSSDDSPWGFTRPGTIKEHLAYIYTDRPIYRPGQTVFFKAIVREDQDALYRLLAEGSEVPLRILDARGNLLETQVLVLNEFGTAHGQFSVGAGASLGEYTLEADLNGEAYQGLFQVQDYRKPDIALEITTEAGGYVAGDLIPVEVQAQYFLGEPVPDAKLEVRLYELAEFYGYWWEPVSEDEQVQYAWYPTYDDPVLGRTDQAGEFSVSLPARLGAETGYWTGWWTGLRETAWGVEVTLDDGSHQTVSAFAVVKVFNTAEQMSLDVGGFFREPGQAFEVEVAVEDLLGQPVAGRNLMLEVRSWDRASYEYDRIVRAATLATGEDGTATSSLESLTPGYYQLRLTNTEARGEDSQISRWIYVYQPGGFWDRLETNRAALTISSDQAGYAPYDTATLYIESAMGGPALLTVERSSIRRERVIELTPPITTVELPILAGDRPNIFVSVASWQAQSTQLTGEFQYTNLPASRLLSASLELPVEAVGRELQLEIISDRPSYGPGDEAEVRLRVTDADGKPAAAEVSLALVDEAIFALSEDLTEPMMEAFYGRRANGIRTYSSLAPYREIFLDGRGGGGDGGPGSPGNPRSDFEDLAAWFPDLRTDANGEAVVRITLPHNLTSWRFVARAVTRDTRVGEASLNIVTRQDLVVRPILPRQLTAGDSMTLSVLVHNFSDLQQSIEVVLESDELQMEGEETQSIDLGAGETGVVGWTVSAEAAGQAGVTITAQAGDLSDSVQLSLPVQPLAVPDVFTQVGSFSGEWSTQFVLPRDASPLSTVTLRLDRSVAGTVLSGLEFLTGFPYGCVEQIMSRALPNAVVGRAAARLGLSGPGLEAELLEKVNQGTQMLYAMQHADGGWGWWYDDRSHDYQTAWVVFGLAVTRQAGYLVDDDSLARGAGWLADNLDDMDPRTRAFALYSLALAGFPEEEASLALADDMLGLDPFSQAALALALSEAGQAEQALVIVDELEAGLLQVGDQAYWPAPHEDGHYYEKTMASSTRSTALGLVALVRIDPDYPGIEGVVRWLVAHRRPSGWGTTNETSFAVLGLTDYILAQEAAEGESGYRVTLNGEEYAQGALAGQGGTAEVVIPADDLRVGSNELLLQQEGEGKLYYALTTRMLRPQPAIDPAGVVSVTRSYRDAESGARIESAQAGQLLQVELEVVLPVDGFYLLIEDKLPGGLEALNESLNSESHLFDDSGNGIYYWEELGYNYKEVRGDRVSFFVTELVAGSYTYSYLARATHAGEFVALPAEVSAMYDLALWGRSGSNVLEVVPGPGGRPLASVTQPQAGWVE